MRSIKLLPVAAIICFSVWACGCGGNESNMDTYPLQDTSGVETDTAAGNTNGYAPPHTDSNAANKDSLH